MPVSKWSISFMPGVAEEVEKRSDTTGERSMRVNRMLDRYFATLQWCRRDLRKLLNDQEIALILDSLNGVAHYDTYSIQLVWAGVADSIEMDELDKKWEVNGPELVAKLKALDYAHEVALVDAAEMWWNRVGNGEQPEYKEALEPAKKATE